jgi:hypothetical protein
MDFKHSRYECLMGPPEWSGGDVAHLRNLSDRSKKGLMTECCHTQGLKTPKDEHP